MKAKKKQSNVLRLTNEELIKDFKVCCMIKQFDAIDESTNITNNERYEDVHAELLRRLEVKTIAEDKKDALGGLLFAKEYLEKYNAMSNEGFLHIIDALKYIVSNVSHDDAKVITPEKEDAEVSERKQNLEARYERCDNNNKCTKETCMSCPTCDDYYDDLHSLL